ncbi:hypothetical protein R3P38DRAFT_3362883 [Favolaschia claudopus]|uniref:Uncharacterized protein n=1 Tax=Favolaschia claudopus TaxID=2862362 RepID=A0AAW0AKB3_9AGAR
MRRKSVLPTGAAASELPVKCKPGRPKGSTSKKPRLSNESGEASAPKKLGRPPGTGYLQIARAAGTGPPEAVKRPVACSRHPASSISPAAQKRGDHLAHEWRPLDWWKHRDSHPYPASYYEYEYHLCTPLTCGDER